ncbi:MAG: Uma2 family endonuclease, partial [Chloroflexaceae bacterium]|nr:Uma2 family endonuclease [Chloroflexaceae bacterium]
MSLRPQRSPSNLTVLPSSFTLYPESDGQPMADNTWQYFWNVLIKENLECLFAHRDDVFVASNLFWYAVEGDPAEVAAPDVMVVFGRPKGHRRRYLEWEEENIGPQVVFEILSPSNTAREMRDKFDFYERNGVEEYYIYNPGPAEPYPYLRGYIRRDGQLQPIEQMNGWVSPLLGILFDMSSGELRLFHPDGQPFRSPVEMAEERERERLSRKQ